MKPRTREIQAYLGSENDADRVAAFYATDQSGFLLPRTIQEIARALEARTTFLGVHGSEVVAVASSFEPVWPYIELGGSLVAPTYRGFGLQRLMFAARFANVLLNQGPEVVITTSIKENNPKSILNATKLGFETWAEPALELLGSCGTCPKRNPTRCCATYYRIPRHKVAEAVSALLRATEAGPAVTIERGGDTLVVRLLVPAIMGRHRDGLREVVDAMLLEEGRTG
ncbi:MAG: hypothetical protein KBG48_11410 [Kofleriaceae bacterium]|nr:hypothetical protein [Kofleriaceae bacterium]MBP9167992.1 hypothetical protein [Kofleriaceae bacterium]MBP9856826.1 hypothetical protein [Kofleriaceae bacterium]